MKFPSFQPVVYLSLSHPQLGAQHHLVRAEPLVLPHALELLLQHLIGWRFLVSRWLDAHIQAQGSEPVPVINNKVEHKHCIDKRVEANCKQWGCGNIAGSCNQESRP